MKESRIHYNFQLPKAYDKVIWHIYALLQKDPQSIGKIQGYTIKKTDIFKYMFDMIADHFMIDLKVENGFTLEIVDKKVEKDEREVKLAIILSEKYYREQEEYIDQFKDDMTLFEFCDMKGIDWLSLLRDDRTNKSEK